MARLEDLKRGVKVKGILPSSIVTLVDVEKYGSDAVSVIYTVVAQEVAVIFNQLTLAMFLPRCL
ncbi:hypothetical protein [Iningainema tapete]|uniref:hypothetical protein n=1 Tax=Iningainema tapete TaxID=2806730 RepID=UPI00192D8017|nr:hypothetical protein [Iningainema tapete]